MPARVICISRARGAGGEAIGRMVTNALRFRYVDDEILVRAAEKADVDRELVADVEHRKASCDA
ncbi:MAG TPA: cytidylate kinase family protein [Dehalococcoidia bacterium]|nr:cytidylate kinase family protein [Dehalococcoidia bacterium]